MVVTWNTLDKSANISLSGGSLVATTTSATQGAVRAGTATAATKTYVEFQITNVTGSLWAVGFANATAGLGTALGSDTNSVVYQPNTASGRLFFNNASLGSDTFTPVVGQTVCVAFDPFGKLIWARINNGLWNGSTAADPASGAGGRSVAAIAAGPYFPVFGDNGSGGAVTARFGALNMWFPVPSGFSDLDVTSQSYEAVSKMDGMVILGAPQNTVSISKMLGYAITHSQFPNFNRARQYEYLRE